MPIYPEEITYSLENFGRFVTSNVELCSNVVKKKGMSQMQTFVDNVLKPMLEVDYRKRDSATDMLKYDFFRNVDQLPKGYKTWYDDNWGGLRDRDRYSKKIGAEVPMKAVPRLQEIER